MNKSETSVDEKVKEAEDASRSYEDAISELQGILNKLKDGEVNVDELVEQVTRSSDLIDFCQKKISDAEMQVQEIVTTIEKDVDINVDTVVDADTDT